MSCILSTLHHFTAGFSAVTHLSLPPAATAAVLVANEILSKVSVALVGGTERLNRLDERWVFRDAL